MTRPRDRSSSKGLLPRMEARPWADGVTVSYRYHPVSGKPIPLGTDRLQAIQRVLDMTGRAKDTGTVGALWRAYTESPQWADLADTTRKAYAQQWAILGRVFGEAASSTIRPADVARYLRVERAGAPVSANREVALLSNLMNLALERGELEANPCRQVRRNPERPRPEAPEAAEVRALVEWANGSGRRAYATLAAMASYAAMTGQRRCEFIDLAFTQVGEGEIRARRRKQRAGKEVWDLIEITPELRALLDRQRASAADERCGAVFPCRSGGPYTEPGFKAMWARMMAAAVAEGIVSRRFSFHDLRAFYATQHKLLRGALPDMHQTQATTARVYDRSKISRRRAL